MASGAVVRLQNLPWSANASDIREFFYGLEIPNGGVRIIGGDDGDCFVAFVNIIDAQNALRKDRSYIKDQQIKLYSSSEEEMQYIIAIAKGENPPKPASMYTGGNASDGGYYRKQTSSSTFGDESTFNSRNNNNFNSGREIQPRDNSIEGKRYVANQSTDTAPYGRRSPIPNTGNDHFQGSGDPTSYRNYQQYGNTSEGMSNFSGKSERNNSASVFPNQYGSDARYARSESTPNPNKNDFNQTSGMYDVAYQRASVGNFPKANSPDNPTVQVRNHASTENYVLPQQTETNNKNNNMSNDKMHQFFDQRQFDRQWNTAPAQSNQFTPSRDFNQPASNFYALPKDSVQTQHPSPANYTSPTKPSSHSDFSHNQGRDPYQSAPGFNDFRGNNYQDSGLLGGSGMPYSQIPKDGSRLQPPNAPNSLKQIPPQIKRDPSSDYLEANRFSRGSQRPGQYNDDPQLKNEESRDSAMMGNRQSSGSNWQRPHGTASVGDTDQRRPQGVHSQAPPFTYQRQDHFSQDLQVADRDDRVDSDLRSDANTHKEGRLATTSKSAPLLPTPNIKPAVLPLLDMEVSPISPTNSVTGGPQLPHFPPKFDCPPPNMSVDKGKQHTSDFNRDGNFRMEAPGLMPTNVNKNQSALIQPPDGRLCAQPNDSGGQLQGFHSNIPQQDGFQNQLWQQQNMPREEQQSYNGPPSVLHQQQQSRDIHQWPQDSNLLSQPQNRPFDSIPQPQVEAIQFQQTEGRNFHQSSSEPVKFSNASEVNEINSVVPVIDPCALFTNLPGDVQYKQIRGLFATHNIMATDIKIHWPPRAQSFKEPAEAVVLFDTVNGAVAALNELKGMKISGRVIEIQPCPKSRYVQFNQDSSIGKTVTRPMRDNANYSSKRSWNDDSRRENSGRFSPDRSRLRRSASSPHRDQRSRHSRSPPNRDQRNRRSRSPRRNRSRSPRNVDRDRRRSPVENRGNRPRRLGDRAEFRMGDQSESKRGDQKESKTGEPYETRMSARFKNVDAKVNESPPQISNTSSWSAVLTGLPSMVTISDIEQFLTDIQYNAKSLYLEMNVHGECTGTAYVELNTEHSLRMLVNSPKELLKQTIQISSIPKDKMAAAVAEHKRNLATDKTIPGEFILQLTGLPLDATPKTVTDFLYPTKLKESEVTIVKAGDGSGRCTGGGFVKVHSIKDREEALKHDRGYIGKRYVTIRVVSEKAMVDQLVKLEPKDVKGVKSNPLERTIRMVNLRYELKSEQVEAFFRDYNPESGSVHFNMLNGMPTGKGTIRMKSAVDAKNATEELNKMELAGRPILLAVSR